jgi:hypothetical protein
MSEIDKILGALELGEKIMKGGKRAVQLGDLAAQRIRSGKCAVCGSEEIMEGSPIGADCAKRGAGLIIDLMKNK